MQEIQLSPRDAADLLEVSTATVLRWIREGKLNAVRVGRRYRISEDSINQFLNATWPTNQSNLDYASRYAQGGSWIPPKAAAELLLVATPTVLRWIKQLKISAVRAGREYRVSEYSVKQFMDGARTTNQDNLTNVSQYAQRVTFHITRLTVEIMEHPEFDKEHRDTTLHVILDLQNQLLDLETSPDEPLIENVSLIQASLREIHSCAPRWVMERIRAMFSDQAFASSMGVALGVALTKGFG